MPAKHQKKPAPRTNAPVKDHKKHADEILADEKYKKKPDTYQELNDEAKP